MRCRIASAILMLLLVPAFAQVLSARVLLRCADGRECFLPPHEIEPECLERTACCGGEPELPAAPIAEPDQRPCVWMVTPALDVNYSVARPLIVPPHVLWTIAARDLEAARISNESQWIGHAIEHVPIDWPIQVMPGEGVGPRSPPHDDV